MAIRLSLAPGAKIPERYRGKRSCFSDVPHGYVDIDAKGDVIASAADVNLVLPYDTQLETDDRDYAAMIARQQQNIHALLRRQVRMLAKRGQVVVATARIHEPPPPPPKQQQEQQSADVIYDTLLAHVPDLDLATLFTELGKTQQPLICEDDEEEEEDKKHAEEDEKKKLEEDEEDDDDDEEEDDDDDNDDDDEHRVRKPKKKRQPGDEEEYDHAAAAEEEEEYPEDDDNEFGNSKPHNEQEDLDDDFEVSALENEQDLQDLDTGTFDVDAHDFDDQSD